MRTVRREVSLLLTILAPDLGYIKLPVLLLLAVRAARCGLLAAITMPTLVLAGLAL